MFSSLSILDIIAIITMALAIIIAILVFILIAVRKAKLKRIAKYIDANYKEAMTKADGFIIENKYSIVYYLFLCIDNILKERTDGNVDDKTKLYDFLRHGYNEKMCFHYGDILNSIVDTTIQRNFRYGVMSFIEPKYGLDYSFEEMLYISNESKMWSSMFCASESYQIRYWEHLWKKLEVSDITIGQMKEALEKAKEEKQANNRKS